MVQLAVKVLPKSSKNDIVGWSDAAKSELAIRVAAPPINGSANEALIKLVAKELGIAKSRVGIKRGQTSRHKLLELDITKQELEEWLAIAARV